MNNQPAEDEIFAAPMEARSVLFRDQIGKNQFYTALNRGEIPSVKIGARRFVPLVAARRKLAADAVGREAVANA